MESRFSHLDLFSGIGGFAYAGKQVWGEEYECIGFVEIDKFCRAVLRKRFEGVPIYGDIKEITGEIIADTDERIQREKSHETKRQFRYKIEKNLNLLTGGFPCQPFSVAGRRKGKEDDRYLWKEMLRIIEETRPRWVIGENVAGIIKMALDEVLSDLESIGYSTQPIVIPACAKNAPHRRDRVWIIANSICIGNGGRDNGDSGRMQCTLQTERPDCNADHSNSGNGIKGKISQMARKKITESTRSSQWDESWLEVATRFCGVDDGFPAELDGLKLSKAGHRVERLKSLGNAIVPQVAQSIFQAIKDCEDFK